MRVHHAVNSGAASRATSGRRPRIWPALLKRELDLPLGALVLLCVAGSLLIAREAAGLVTGQAGGLSLLVRRFDITLLFVMAFLAVLRIAARIDTDHVAGWLMSPCAAGGARGEYGPALTASAFTASSLIFIAGAISFGVGVSTFAGSTELLRALPRTLGGGLLVLACFSIYGAVLGLLFRHTYATVFVAAALLVIPCALTVPYLGSGAPPPLWLHFWLNSYPPPLTLPADDQGIVHAIAYVIIGGSGLRSISSRYTARHS